MSCFKVGRAFRYFKNNCDYIAWNGGERLLAWAPSQHFSSLLDCDLVEGLSSFPAFSNPAPGPFRGLGSEEPVAETRRSLPGTESRSVMIVLATEKLLIWFTDLSVIGHFTHAGV